MYRASILDIALTAAVTTGILSAGAQAGGFVVPAGFNFESVPAAGPAVTQLLDGRILVSTGFFGADELSVLQPDGTAVLFATGFGSLAGVAQSPVTGDIDGQVLAASDCFLRARCRLNKEQ